MLTPCVMTYVIEPPQRCGQSSRQAAAIAMKPATRTGRLRTTNLLKRRPGRFSHPGRRGSGDYWTTVSPKPSNDVSGTPPIGDVNVQTVLPSAVPAPPTQVLTAGAAAGPPLVRSGLTGLPGRAGGGVDENP